MDLLAPDTLTDASSPASPDGRRARRDRNTDAVIDAMLEIFAEGDGFPTAQQVANRSGVSLRSVFRYFQDLDSLVTAAVGALAERYADVLRFDPPGPAAPLADRVEYMVQHRVRSYEATGPTVRAAIARSQKHARLRAVVEGQRMHAIHVLTELFAPELQRLPPDQRPLVVAAAQTATLFEAWDNMVTRHGMSSAQIAFVFRRLLFCALAPPD